MSDSDHTTEAFQQLQSRNDDELIWARFLAVDEQELELHEDSISWILNNIDCFVVQSRSIKTVETLVLNHVPFDSHGDGSVWDKAGQAVGNLQALDKILISTDHQDGEGSPTPDWETVARILSHVRQRITLRVDRFLIDSVWHAENINSFARAIHGHPTNTGFESDMLLFQASDSIYSALATLPALESLSLSNSARHENLTDLLRLPTLRSVDFYRFSFTPALCQATANALMPGTTITSLKFLGCSFSAGECATMLATAFSRNTSVLYIEVVGPLEALCNALTVALPSNSTLQELFLSTAPLPPVFLSLGKNTGLQTLSVVVFNNMDEPLCTAIEDGLATNTTLKHLKFKHVFLYDDTAHLWSRAFLFFRTNKSLKSLMIETTGSFFATLRCDIASMLQENASLESLSIQGSHNAKATDYIALVSALQHNRTLKKLRFDSYTIRLTDDEDKQIAALLRKNNSLESLSDTDLLGDAGAILRLNAAGRRYLIEDGSSVSKGVEVLSSVRSDIDCLFLHLLENPRLCDRSAVESANDNTDNGGSTRPIKREHGQAQNEGRESRRRLT
jgi:hypothetical protein